MPVTIADAGRVELYAKVMSKLAHLQREARRTRKRRDRFRKTRRNHGSGARKENWQSTQQQDLALENARRRKQSGGKATTRLSYEELALKEKGRPKKKGKRKEKTGTGSRLNIARRNHVVRVGKGGCCFAFNKPEGCAKGDACEFQHICVYCEGPHSIE